MYFNKTILLTIIILLLLVLLPSKSFAAFNILSSTSQNEVEIDGKWTTPNEWGDATEFSVKKGMHVLGYFLIKDDEQNLYVLIDCIKDISKDHDDKGLLRIDSSMDKEVAQMTGCPIGGCSGFLPGPSPQEDDYVVALDWSNGVSSKTIWQGNGTGWILSKKELTGIKASSSYDGEFDPYNSESHIIYEFIIPREIFGNKSEIGFSAFAINKAEGRSENMYLALPSYSNHLKPYTWAILSFSTPFTKQVITTTLMPNSTKTTTTTTTKVSKETQSTITTAVIPSEESIEVKGEHMITEIPVPYIVITGIATVSILMVGVILKIRNKK